jgi:hypothetical protein
MFARLHLLISVAVLLTGCTSVYFQPVEPVPEPVPQYRLAGWPDREYWAGVVFNGEKIGFTHLVLDAAASPGLFEIRSDAAFALRFLGVDKRVSLKAYDLVRPDLDLVAFSYEYVMDGSAVALDGERSGDTLAVTIRQGATVDRQVIDARGPVYPLAASVLYPSLHGLAPGREFRYPVYSGELQKIAQVVQRIVAYERSTLFEGTAYHIETAMEGYRVETWISPRGAPLLEIAMNGVLISGREDEARARNYLAAASLSKSEALIEFALAKPDRPIAAPRKVTMMRIALAGAAGAVPSDGTQHCAGEAGETVCTVRTSDAASAQEVSMRAADPRYLASTFTVTARDPGIVATAREIGRGASDAREQVRRIVAWMQANVRVSPVDVWSAVDALQRREAECQGHAYLYAALARALGVPTRVVNGIVYAEDFEGFLYHAWAESLVDGRWRAIDPTFGSAPADATHVKLVEGETLAELTALVDWVGRLKVRVIAVEHGR